MQFSWWSSARSVYGKTSFQLLVWWINRQHLNLLNMSDSRYNLTAFHCFCFLFSPGPASLFRFTLYGTCVKKQRMSTLTKLSKHFWPLKSLQILSCCILLPKHWSQLLDKWNRLLVFCTVFCTLWFQNKIWFATFFVFSANFSDFFTDENLNNIFGKLQTDPWLHKMALAKHTSQRLCRLCLFMCFVSFFRRGRVDCGSPHFLKNVANFCCFKRIKWMIFLLLFYLPEIIFELWLI